MAELVHQFKYNNNLDLLKYFSKILKAEFHKYFKASEIDKIIPVPVSKQRMQKRGYNQAKKLLDEFNINISDKTVIRMKHTKPQSLYQKKKKRKLNIKNAFKVIKDVSNEKVVIVDDLVTTGATLNEISKALYKKGAEKIYHLTLIRAR